MSGFVTAVPVNLRVVIALSDSNRGTCGSPKKFVLRNETERTVRSGTSSANSMTAPSTCRLLMTSVSSSRSLARACVHDMQVAIIKHRHIAYREGMASVIDGSPMGQWIHSTPIDEANKNSPFQQNKCMQMRYWPACTASGASFVLISVAERRSPIGTGSSRQPPVAPQSARLTCKGWCFSVKISVPPRRVGWADRSVLVTSRSCPGKLAAVVHAQGFRDNRDGNAERIGNYEDARKAIGLAQPWNRPRNHECIGGSDREFAK